MILDRPRALEAVVRLLCTVVFTFQGVNALAVTLLSGVGDIAVGTGHTCALKLDGSVLCWGNNEYGILGVGKSTAELRASSVPVVLPALSGVGSIAAGPEHTCVAKRDGTVWCWGKNVSGQLGNNTQDDQRAPVRAVGLAAAVSVHAGSYHSCAITTARTVYCWGGHYFPSLIDGRTDGPYLRPTLVPNLNNVVSLGLGADHSCALLSDGSVRCWGSAYNGRLGIGATTESYFSAPQPVVGIEDAVGIAAASSHTCVVRSNGKIACWGYARDGIVGPVDDGVYDALTPNAVPITGFAQQISTRFSHSCALTEDGTVRCWGNDGLYQYLGTGARIDSSAVPLVARLDAPAAAIAVGKYHSCALMRDTTVKCWGVDSIGSLGLGRTGEYFVPPLPQPVLTAGVYPDVSVSASALELSINDTVVLSAEIAGRTPTGALTFMDGESTLCANVPLLTRRLEYVRDVRYEAFCAVPPALLRVGERQFTVRYGGDGNNLPAASAPAWQSLRVANGPARLRSMIEFRNAPLDYYFITSRSNEISGLDTPGSSGWTRTGESFRVFTPEAGVGMELTRYYFDRVAKNKTRGSHFYTVRDSDRVSLRSQNPGNSPVPGKPFEEGPDSYVAGLPYQGYSPFPCHVNQVEVYRLFRSDPPFADDANHRFTTNYDLVKQFMAAGWRFEGVAFCAPR